MAFAHRWGGFFVTGKTDALSHLGNAAFKGESEAESVEANLKGFLAPTSDIVALMVFEITRCTLTSICWTPDRVGDSLRAA